MDFTQFDRLISLTPASASPNEAIATTLDGRKVTLSVASFGEGVVRVRMNASAKPDYGLLLAHADDAVATTDGSSLSRASVMSPPPPVAVTVPCMWQVVPSDA